VVGVYVLQADEHPADAGAFALRDEVRDLVAERVDLDHQPDAHALALPERYDPVEDDLPVLVAGEIVVGDEVVVDALREVLADELLDVVGRAATRFAALHVDDRAERALERATAPRVEAGIAAERAGDIAGGQEGRRRAFDARQ